MGLKNKFLIKESTLNIVREVAFILFLLSGSIKPVFNLLHFPIDLTLLLFILLTSDFILRASLRKIKFGIKTFSYIIVFFLYFGLIIISYTYTPSKEVSVDKIIQFLLSVIGLLYGALIVKKISIDRFYKILLPFSVIESILFIVLKYVRYSTGYGYLVKDIFEQMKGSYLSMGIIISFTIIIAIVEKRNYWIGLLLMLLHLGLGSRGALVFTIITVFPVVTFRAINANNLIIKKKALKILVVIIAFLLYFWELILKVSMYGLERFSTLFNLANDQSNLGRLDRYEFVFTSAFASIKGFFIGYGIGSYGLLRNGIDELDYPHNVFLESQFELGIVGLILGLILFIYPFVFKSNLIIRLILIFLFLSAMKTGSITSVRMFYSVVGLTIASNTYVRFRTN